MPCFLNTEVWNNPSMLQFSPNDIPKGPVNGGLLVSDSEVDLAKGLCAVPGPTTKTGDPNQPGLA